MIISLTSKQKQERYASFSKDDKECRRRAWEAIEKYGWSYNRIMPKLVATLIKPKVEE